MGQILWVEANVAGSLEFHGKALELNQKLVSEVPGDREVRFDLASSYTNFGHMLAASGRAQEGLQNTRQAVLLMEELAVAEPNNNKVQQGLAQSYDRVAEILTLAMGNHPEALLLYRKSQKIKEGLAVTEPANTTFRRSRADGYFRVASVLAKLGDAQTALDGSRKSSSLFAELLSADPQNDEFRQRLAQVQTFVGEMMIRTGSAAEAIKLLNQPLLTLQKSSASSPTDENAHFRLANAQAAMGKGYAALASDDQTSRQKRLAYWREARSWFQKSMEIYKSFVRPVRQRAKTVPDLM
jgi:tetratricopeptide (TPR) repeat protein